MRKNLNGINHASYVISVENNKPTTTYLTVC